MRTLTILLLFLTAIVAGAAVYRWVDEEGIVQYSDRPAAEMGKLREPPSPGADQAPAGSAEAPAAEDVAENAADAAEQREAYRQFSIISPQDNEFIRSNSGDVHVVFLVEPALYEGDRFDLLLDGISIKLGTVSAKIVLQSVLPGPHTLQAHILDSEGEILLSAAPVRFILHKTTLSEQELAKPYTAKELEQLEQRKELYEEQRELDDRLRREQAKERELLEKKLHSDYGEEEQKIESGVFDPSHPSFERETQYRPGDWDKARQEQYQKDAPLDTHDFPKTAPHQPDTYQRQATDYPYQVSPQSGEQPNKYESRAQTDFSRETATQQFGPDAATKAFAPPSPSPSPSPPPPPAD